MQTFDRSAASRRIEMALALLEEGSPGEACELATEACMLDPSWPDAWFVRAESSERADAPKHAIEAYRRCLALDPDDRLGARPRLALLGAEQTPARLPKAYVQTLFDQMAARFEESLVGRLHYCGPSLLMDRLAPFRDDLPEPLIALDIGCGTGLAGVLLRPLAAQLHGFDLSRAMVANAARRRIYDELRVGDLFDPPDATAPSYGLAVAADVFCYVGDLAPALTATAARLQIGGYLAFTVEAGDDAPYTLRPTQRYSHAPDAVDAWLAGAGFELLDRHRAMLRRERHEPVDGLFVIARRIR